MATALQRERRRSARARQHRHDTDPDAFAAVHAEILRRAAPCPDQTAVDLGAGTGLLTIPLAQVVKSVVAIDPAQTLLEELRHRAGAAGLGNLVPIAADLAEVALPCASVDLVVSNYAFHHLHHADKRAVISRARRWLRPGGRLVIGDMMFGRGFARGDQVILRTKVRSLAAKGPGGVWRIVKNLARFGLHIGGSYPAPPRFWVTALQDAGFQSVGHEQVRNEAGVVWGRL